MLYFTTFYRARPIIVNAKPIKAGAASAEPPEPPPVRAAEGRTRVRPGDPEFNAKVQGRRQDAKRRRQKDPTFSSIRSLLRPCVCLAPLRQILLSSRPL